MPDYIYLLENRLSADQQNALRQMREAAREDGTILFLTGDAVRDLTSGHAVRDLEITVHGNAIQLKKTIEKLGGKVWGEDDRSHSLYLCFPGTVRLNVIRAQRVEYPKPGKPVYHAASIQEDLRRRDFTVNAMALSLNEGSYGLLMDPLNGTADIEARTLRLVSNYGFLEEPSLLIRATRYRARLGWELDPKTQTRYENAKNEGVIEFLSDQARSQELEQIGHEEEGLKILGALEAEGWMQVLFPAWSTAKADEEKLATLHSQAVGLLAQGVHADMSAAQMQLLTARMTAKELAALKALMLRPGFLEEWNSLDRLAAGFAKVLLAKENLLPSASYKLFTGYDPEAILWLGFTSKDAAVRERFNLFLKVWPEARQKIPHSLLQEMRITPELAGYREIVHSVFLQLIDGKLGTTEEMKGFLEPFSPPAPPPKEVIKRPRAKRGEARIKESYDDDEHEDERDEDEDLDDLGSDDDERELGMNLPKVTLDAEIGDEDDEDEDAERPKVTRSAEASASKAAPKAKTAPSKTVAAKAAAPTLVEPVKTELPVAAKAEKPTEKTAVPAKAEAAKVKKAEPEVKGKIALAVKGAALSSEKAVAPAVALKPVPVAKAAPAIAAKKAASKPQTAKALPSVGGKAIALPGKGATKTVAAAPHKVAAKAAVKVAAKAPAGKVPATKTVALKGNQAHASKSEKSSKHTPVAEKDSHAKKSDKRSHKKKH
jgi:tRNA nucleotidyltransferase/poly(A) polymerase